MKLKIIPATLLTFALVGVMTAATGTQISGVVATAVSPTSIQVTWTTDVASDSFVYYDSSHDSGVRDTAGVTNHSLTISGLRPGQSYSFGVRSRAIIAGKPATLPAFSPTANFTMPKALSTGTFDYYLSPEGPHHVVQGYDLFIQLNAGYLSGVASFKNGSYKITVQKLPPNTALHWPDQEFYGPINGVRSTTYTANDTIAFWGPGTTQFELVTNQGGATPPGSYTLNITASTLLTDGSSGPKKTVPWIVVVEPVLAFAFGTPSSYPPIPKLREWQSNMMFYGSGNWCNLLTRSGKPCAPGYEPCSWYYDGERVFYQIADYTKHKKWETCALNAQANYRDQYVLAQKTPGAIGAWRVFPDGIYMNYLRTGDATSKAAVHALATNAAGAKMWTWHVPTGFIREATYMLTADRLDTKLGNDRSRRCSRWSLSFSGTSTRSPQGRPTGISPSWTDWPPKLSSTITRTATRTMSAFRLPSKNSPTGYGPTHGSQTTELDSSTTTHIRPASACRRTEYRAI